MKHFSIYLFSGVIDYEERYATEAFEYVIEDKTSAKIIVIPMSYADLEYDRIQESKCSFQPLLS